jgi:hypothetical protein
MIRGKSRLAEMRGSAIVIIKHVEIAAARLAYVLDLANAETPRTLNALEANGIAHKRILDMKSQIRI